MKPTGLYSRDEMLELNIQTLKERTVTVEEIAEVAYRQQAKWSDQVSMADCIDSVEKILSLRDVFHILQLGAEIDRLTDAGLFKGPIQDILKIDLGMFGIDELFGLELAGLYGTIGKTNFGDIDVNKPLVIDRLNGEGKHGGMCHTFMDDIVGALAAAASTRVAQMLNEIEAHKDPNVEEIKLDLDV
ncbi:phosphatidylglycerophosphatase A [Candidatus Xianfuyuplasma coldseepsis]|uniref:Phosphatidylglycerophosphatase A n=1 Tax=Candidatus Xianfuyuplasma coldseepsis TaxID=2782163 RepID=A0A7L7KNS2_9MOLU|nr:phosphatidylglycerophosphatase A [Xianfuyuplasma coldseepsis]QMS84333.1 phosphatidylglycerophosphatase A [Xianfuyuplasma coldseepsis]